MPSVSMNRDEVKTTLRGNIGRTVVATFGDGVICKLTPLTVDDEGFVFEVEPGEIESPDSMFWTRFEDLVLVEQSGEES